MLLKSWANVNFHPLDMNVKTSSLTGVFTSKLWVWSEDTHYILDRNSRTLVFATLSTSASWKVDCKKGAPNVFQEKFCCSTHKSVKRKVLIRYENQRWTIFAFYLEVFYVDFGNKGKADGSQIRRMEPEFIHLPFQCVECCLPIAPVQPGWSRQARYATKKKLYNISMFWEQPV